MTFDHTDLPPDDDELAVAAVVDGEATAEQRRRVARNPGLVARVRASETARQAVRAPIDPLGDVVFAALRARALDAADEVPGAVAVIEADDDDHLRADDQPEPSRVMSDDLAPRRARRARRLPPLPAVAAVVLILLLGGIALLVTDGGDDADQRAGTSADATSAESGGGSESLSEAPTEGGDEGAAADASPVDEFRDALLARTTSAYGDEEALFDALRRVDPDTLDLTSGAAAGEREDGDEPDATDGGTEATTTAPTPSSAATGAVDGRALADDDDVQRCDAVLRSAEPDVGPASAAAFVAVEGVPVLVLSNPVEATDDGPATTRLTVLNAVDCSPRGAVQR